MKFVAIDVETANADVSSICQIGIACYDSNGLADEFKTYVDPNDYFDEVNISIHGIDEFTVKGAPQLPEITAAVYNYTNDIICVCHTHFDRVAIQRAFNKYGFPSPTCTWLDSACVARRAWAEFSHSGYGLHNVCTSLGYQFKHHDALEDAKAAGHVVIAAIQHTGIPLHEWPQRVKLPIALSFPKVASDKKFSTCGGPLEGAIVVFTGSLAIPRHIAAEMVMQAGGAVDKSLTTKSTILVVGDQDLRRLAGHEKSSKHRKAEAMIAAKHPIRIIGESDFINMIDKKY